MLDEDLSDEEPIFPDPLTEEDKRELRSKGFFIDGIFVRSRRDHLGGDDVCPDCNEEICVCDRIFSEDYD